MTTTNEEIYNRYKQQIVKSIKTLATLSGKTPQRISQIVKQFKLAENIDTLLTLLVEKFDMQDFTHEQMNALDYLQKYVNEVRKGIENE